MWLEGARKTVLFITHSINEAVLLSDRVVVLSPRPGRIGRVLSIDLPRPRRMHLVNQPAFGDYAGAIRDIFKAEGVLSE